MFQFSKKSTPVLGLICRPIHWVSSAISLGVEGPGRESNQSQPSSAEVKNGVDKPPLSHMSSLFYIETV
jgi:hypothetical protein